MPERMPERAIGDGSGIASQHEFDMFKSATNQTIANLASGSPRGFFATLAELVSAYPTGTTGTFVITGNGWLYGYVSGAWTQLVQYQSTGLADGSVTKAKLAPDTKVTEDWNTDNILYGIVDTQNRAALTVDNQGVTTIQNLKLGAGSTLSETVIQGVSEVSAEITGVLWGIVDANDRLSDIAIGEDGRILQQTIDSWATRMSIVDDNSNKPIDLWGDSMTGGAAGLSGNQLWAGKLAVLTSRVINNMGVGGETSATISMRQGGSTGFTGLSFTIPADTSAVMIANESNLIKDNWGLNCRPLLQAAGSPKGVNPVSIAGVTGNLSYSSSSWYFSRSTPGSAVTVNRPTAIITSGSNDNRENIMIIWSGTNGGYSSDQELVEQLQRMVDWNTSRRKEYLVLGMINSSLVGSQNVEKLMAHAFGRRFINLREYMVAYGLQDAGLTATSEDNTFIAQGKVPPSLLATSMGGANAGDYTHMNEAGHTIVANLVYKRLVELKII